MTKSYDELGREAEGFAERNDAERDADLTASPWLSPFLRSDGLSIRRRGEAWIIVPPAPRATMSTCPCCDRPFATPRAAQRIADEVYPMTQAS